MLFSSLPLHDALLEKIFINWKPAQCEFRLCPVGLPAHVLVFEGFTNINLPRRENWGPSSSIDTVIESQKGLFEIELQSGDTIRIEASRWDFRPKAN